jgi:hypothetical protein
VIAVLASANDTGADALLARWAGAGARCLTPGDLCQRGWTHRPGCGCGEAVVDGAAVPVRDFKGVVTRLMCVTERDLVSIVPHDRAYVAAEMTAFLLAWLSSLPCPVVNRPSPQGLAGPNLRPETWLALASEVGIPVRPLRRDRHGYGEPDGAVARDEVTVVGERALGGTSARARERAVRLAQHSGAEVMVAGFDAGEPDEPLIDAHVWPDLGRADVGDALLELLTDRAGGRR